MFEQPTAKTATADRDLVSRIVAVARRHFFGHGFRGVTMDDLAEELGMSKKTLYRAFPSKTALLEAAIHDKFQSVEADLERIRTTHSADALESLHHLLACLQHHTEEIKPPFVRDIQRAAPDLFQIVERNRRDLIQRYFGRIFEAGRRQGLIRKDIPIRVMIEILVGATEAVVVPRKLTEFGLTPKDGYLSVISVVLKGVVAETRRSKL